MMKPTISLIIPCYNVADYVQAALQSVLDNLSENAYARVECVMVNDGSSDETPQLVQDFIAQKMATKNMVYHYIDQNNAGLSAARNAGLQAAQGDYVLFLDSDDIFVHGALDKILAVLDKESPDIVEFDAQMFVQLSDLRADAPTLYGDYFRDVALLDSAGSLQRAFEENRWYVWSRCYRRELLQKHTFIVGKLFEDMLFTPYVYLDAHKMVRLPEVLLAYRQNAGSITANVSQRHIRDLHSALEMAWDKMSDYPQQQTELRMLQLKTWRLMVAYAVKLFLKTRDVAYLRLIEDFRKQCRARGQQDLGWQLAYFSRSIARRYWRKFGL